MFSQDAHPHTPRPSVPNPIAISFWPSLGATWSVNIDSCIKVVVPLFKENTTSTMVNSHLLWSQEAGSWSRHGHGKTGDAKASSSYLEKLPLGLWGWDSLKSVWFPFLLKQDNLIGKSLATPPVILDYLKHWWSHNIFFQQHSSFMRNSFFFVIKPEARQGDLELGYFAWIAPKSGGLSSVALPRCPYSLLKSWPQ